MYKRQRPNNVVPADSLGKKIDLAIQGALEDGSKTVSISGDGLGDFSGLRSVVGIETLNLSCDLQDLHFLRELQSLRSLTILSDSIVDLGPIGELSNLEYLSLTLSSAEELPPLTKLKNLRRLNLLHCGVFTDL